MMAMLMEMLSCATVWYTAPASACVSAGKMSVMTQIGDSKIDCRLRTS